MFFVIFFQRSQGAVDLTLVADASGESVVDACIQKLSTLKTLSNDFGFIKRIAFVESEFGKSKIGRNNLHGIWQVKHAVMCFKPRI